jgi:hypothetical protein
MKICTNILLEEELGVIVADNPVTSAYEVLDVVNVSCFTVCKTCKILPIGGLLNKSLPSLATLNTSAVVAPLLPLASLIVPSGEDGTERVKFWVAVAD